MKAAHRAAFVVRAPMRAITSTTVSSSASPAAFEARWARFRRRDGRLVERQRLFLATVTTTYAVTPAPESDGGSTVTANLEVGGLLQGLWTLALGQRMAAGFPGYVRREVAAVEADDASPQRGDQPSP